jgi:hypothetical protein
MLRVVWILITSLSLSFLTSLPANSIPNTAPDELALVTKIVTKKTSKKYASITVYAKRGYSTLAVKPTPKVKVSVGKKSCTISASYGSCTIKGVALNSKVKVKVWQFNKHGKSGTITKSIMAKSNTKVFYQNKGNSATKRSQGKVLSTSSMKLLNVQAFNKASSLKSFQGDGGVKASSDYYRLNVEDPNQVVFDMSDAVALARPETPADSSGFYKLESDGSQSDPLINGDVTIQDFYIAPNDDVYAALAGKQQLVTGGTACLLVKINSITGVPTCIDSTLDSIDWNTEGILPMPIQFDLGGNIYYLGQSGNNTVLRKNSNGVNTNLTNANIQISAFYATPNGEVVLCGNTKSNNLIDWVRVLRTDGSLSTLKSGFSCRFMQKFSDGKLWIGNGGIPGYFLRYDFSAKKLIDSPRVTTESVAELGVRWDVSLGTITDSFHFPATKESWGLADNPSTTLVRYTPSLMIAETSLTTYTMGRRVLNTLVLTGLDKNEINKLILYDTQNGNEIVVFDGRNEVEIYDMVFIGGSNKLMFSGLRFSDNAYVVGQVSL